MTSIRTVLAVNMKARRKELKLSQAELAEKIGTSPNYISKIEAEKQFPSVQMIEQLAGALSCDSIDLFSMEIIKKNNLEAVQESLCTEIHNLIICSFHYPCFEWKTFMFEVASDFHVPERFCYEFSEIKFISLKDIHQYKLAFGVRKEIKKFLIQLYVE